MILSRGVKSSLQREPDDFYKQVTGGEFNIRQVTKGAFTQARANLKHEAFIEMNQNVNKSFYDTAPYHVWHQMRLVAADGTRLSLPNHPSIKEEFGEHGFGPKAESKRSLALASFLYDPLNLITLDAQIEPYSSNERELLFAHLDKLSPKDLLLLDRGYPGIALFYLLQARGIEFCVRMKEDWWLSVKAFVESGEKETEVEFTLPKKDYPLLKEYPDKMMENIRCRLICIELENGEKEVLCTSLLDTDKYTHEDFAELYHFRWNVEEGYKLFKSRLEVENFSGKTALAVKQDFYAKVFMMSLCAVLAFPIEEKVRQEYNGEKARHQQKINRTSALRMTRDISIGLFIKKLINKALKAFDSIMYKTREIIRPGRKFERKHKSKKTYSMNYKPL